MNNKTTLNTSSFLITNFLYFLIGIDAMLVVSLLLSIVLGKVYHYELILPIVKVFLICIPSFVATVLSINRIKCLIIPIAVLQGTISVIVFILFASFVNGSFKDIQYFAGMGSFALLSSLLSLFLPLFPYKKHKKLH